MHREIKKILSNLKVGNKKIPVEHITYTGKEERYVTWTIINKVPSLEGNDECLLSTVIVDVDVFSKNNYLDIENQIKKLFKENDWVWDGDSSEMYERDTKLYHKTITFVKEKEENNG